MQVTAVVKVEDTDAVEQEVVLVSNVEQVV